MPIIVGNWKAYVESPKEALALLKAVDKGLPRASRARVVVCPPAFLVAHLRATYTGKRVSLGVQDVSVTPQGAHTGEDTATLAKSAGATYAIVGHAERRALGETSSSVAEKVRVALDSKLVPIVCVGESERDREGKFFSYLEDMVLASLARIEARELSKLIVAYEPVWAIGAAQPPDARTVRESVLYIRKTLAARYGREAGLKAKILYGGAVDEHSAPDLIAGGGANGFLVGRASVTAHSFVGIIRACQ